LSHFLVLHSSPRLERLCLIATAREVTTQNETADARAACF